MRRKILSYGGGLDSFTLLVDGLQRGEPPDVCVFADVGSGSREAPVLDGEWPGTYKHIVEVAAPLAEANGIPFVWLTGRDYPVRHGPSLWAYYESKRAIPIHGIRSCTSMAKVERIRDWMWDEFGTEPLEVWIGFDAAEEARVRNDPHSNAEMFESKKSRRLKPLNRVNRYPLMERGLCRCRSEILVREEGLPVPRKSACVFCPSASRGDFIRLANRMPDVFERVVRMEAAEVAKRISEGKPPIYLKNDRPLQESVRNPFKQRFMVCPVCGRGPRATKATDVDWLPPEEYVIGEEGAVNKGRIVVTPPSSFSMGGVGGCDGTCYYVDGEEERQDVIEDFSGIDPEDWEEGAEPED